MIPLNQLYALNNAKDKTLGVYIFFSNPSKCKYSWVVKNFIEYIMLYFYDISSSGKFEFIYAFLL